MFGSAHTQKFGDALDGLETPGLSESGFAGGVRIELMRLPLIAEGGEGWVLDATSVAPGQAIKLFKPPEMLEFKEAAHCKWDEYPGKLAELKKLNLPPAVVAPGELIRAQRAKCSPVIGYMMPLIQGYELADLRTKDGRRAHSASKDLVMRIFRDIYQLSETLHGLGVIIGDNKPQNYIIKGGTAHLIDFESVSLGRQYECHGFTIDYLDPRVTRDHQGFLQKSMQYDHACDRYANEVMLAECLTGIHPFGGIYTPPPGGAEVPEYLRPLKGLSVFHPGVGVPEFIEPFALTLPSQLRARFERIFSSSDRPKMPEQLLKLPWKNCKTCDLEHPYKRCPCCDPVVIDTRIQFGSEQPIPIEITRIPTPGPLAFLSRDTGSQEPLAATIQVSDSKLKLLVNGSVVRNEVPHDACILALPSANRVFLLRQSGSQQSIVKCEAPSGAIHQITGVRVSPTGVQLFQAQENFFAYLDRKGGLILNNANDPGQGIRYDLKLKSPSHLAVGRRIISVVDRETIQIFHTTDVKEKSQQATPKLTKKQVEIPSGEEVKSAQAHPTEALLLVTRQSISTNRFTISIFDLSGREVFGCSSKHESHFWFSNRLINGAVAVIYWQNQKLCEAILSTKNNSLQKIWGISGVPLPDNGSAPCYFNQAIFLAHKGQLVSFNLDKKGE